MRADNAVECKSGAHVDVPGEVLDEAVLPGRVHVVINIKVAARNLAGIEGVHHVFVVLKEVAETRLAVGVGDPYDTEMSPWGGGGERAGTQSVEAEAMR